MFEVSIDGKDVKAEVSFLTAQIYEAEFGGDILQDLFGFQDNDSSPFKFEESGDDGEATISGIDFSKVGWTVLLKALWAAVKTAEPSAPGYQNWMKKTKGTNLWEVRETLLNEVGDCFFRTAPAREEA